MHLLGLPSCVLQGKELCCFVEMGEIMVHPVSVKNLLQTISICKQDKYYLRSHGLSATFDLLNNPLLSFS